MTAGAPKVAVSNRQTTEPLEVIGMELVYVDGGTVPALKLGVTETGDAVVVRLGALSLVKADENGSLDLSTHPADNALAADAAPGDTVFKG